MALSPCRARGPRSLCLSSFHPHLSAPISSGPRTHGAAGRGGGGARPSVEYPRPRSPAITAVIEVAIKFGHVPCMYSSAAPEGVATRGPELGQAISPSFSSSVPDLCAPVRFREIFGVMKLSSPYLDCAMNELRL